MNTSVLTLFVFVIMVQLPGSFARNPFGFGPKLPDWMPYHYGQESDYSGDSDDNSIIQGVPASFGQPNWAGLGGWLMVVWMGGP